MTQNNSVETFKKEDLISAIFSYLSSNKDEKFTKKTIETVFDATLNVLSDILSDNAAKKLKKEHVKLVLRLQGIGSLSLVKRDATTYTVPGKGVIVKKDETLRLKFTPSEVIKRKLNT